LWDGAYVQLLSELKAKNAWFATAGQAVGWFRKRRAVRFENVTWVDGKVRVETAAESGDALPGLKLRIHKPSIHTTNRFSSATAQNFVDVPLSGEIELSLAA
jgi:hypothetical protein